MRNSMPETPTVSIVVPCRNEVKYIARCLSSLLSQERPNGDFEILIADGMSDDGTRLILEQFVRDREEVRVIDNVGRIVSTGLNAAIRCARGRFILRIDAHTEYAPDYVCQSIAVLEETGADAVGGPWVARGMSSAERAIAAAFQSRFCAGGARVHDPKYEGAIDAVYLGCWRRELFAQVGMFDEDLVRNQDDEFSLRLIRLGRKLWQSPRIRSWYTPRGSLRAVFRQYAQYGYWKVRVIQKHKIPASPRHLAPASFALLLSISVIAAYWSPLARWAAGSLAGAYMAGNILASVHAAARSGWTLLHLIPLAFACYHLGYGYGFLLGVWDFVCLRRRPRPHYTTVTRPFEPR
jgi:succinoglycan biosynthesis protein ExoA